MVQYKINMRYIDTKQIATIPYSGLPIYVGIVPHMAIVLRERHSSSNTHHERIKIDITMAYMTYWLLGGTIVSMHLHTC